jgi:hypothetical protein
MDSTLRKDVATAAREVSRAFKESQINATPKTT